MYDLQTLGGKKLLALPPPIKGFPASPSAGPAAAPAPEEEEEEEEETTALLSRAKLIDADIDSVMARPGLPAPAVEEEQVS